MTVRDKVGQLFMIGFQGTDLSGEFLDWLKEYRPGGVILFSRNLVDPFQIARLTNALQEQAPNGPLLIAIDQEGGRVSRLPQGFTIFPPAMAVASCQSADVAYSAAEVTAKELRAVGINMNMAPVLDVNSNPTNPIIGDRAFGQTADLVCTYGTATFQGLQENGVIACGKHFPGHGETVTDSHEVLPVVEVSRTRLEEVELRPFRHAIKNGLATVMSAHVLYPALDAKAPATLSPVILTELLQGYLAFQGLVLTDDLDMKAILNHSSVGDAAVRSLQAGADMLLVCHQQDHQTAAIHAVEKALEDGVLSMNRIESSQARISSLKEQFLPTHRPVNLDTVLEVVGCQSHRDLLQKIQKVAVRS